MDKFEKDYRFAANRIGISLLLFVALFTVTEFFTAIITVLLDSFVSPVPAYVIGEILSMTAYLASFIVPALVLRAMLGKHGLSRSMQLEINMPRRMWLIMPAGVALITCASYLNSFLLEFLNMEDAYTELVGGMSEAYAPHEIVLLFMSIAIVPAFCEEFFFRGVILSSLLPYGKGIAIGASAILFGLMHQNPYQLLYATVAGVVLGYVYVKTKSIWCSTILHFINNAISVLQTVLVSNMDYQAANAILTVAFIVLMVSGAVCFVLYLFADGKTEKKKYSEGSFGILLEEGDSYTQKPISECRMLRGFLGGWMIAALIVLFVNALSVILMLSLVSGGSLM